ncbi:hypothetical protein KM043_002393 [Ampulex compressa]|nr:hypothetical protein KM043_002393 [Ampulex compressa]
MTDSDLAALMHLLKSSIGTGILFLPNAFRRTGYAISIVCGIVMGLISAHTAVTLVHCAQTLCRRNRIPMLDFAKTAEISFGQGPRRIRKYDKMFGVVTNVVICFVHFQAVVIYILYVATSFQQIIEFFTGFETDARAYIGLFFPLTCCLALVPNLKYLAPFSLLGFLLLALGMCIALYYLIEDIPDPERLTPLAEPLAVPVYCGIFLFALHNMTLYLPLENAMSHPGRMPRLIVFSTMLNTCLYVIFGFLGYNKYEDACDTVIKNLPLRDVLAQTVKVAIVLSVLCTFGLTYYVPHTILWPMVQRGAKLDRRHEVPFRLCGVIATTLVAIAVPEMVPLLGLFAAVSMSTIMLLIPIVIEMATKWEVATRVMYAKNGCILVLWILILVFGVIESTRRIIREYGGTKEHGC